MEREHTKDVTTTKDKKGVSEEEKQHLRSYLSKYHFIIEMKPEVELESWDWSTDSYNFDDIGYINLTQCTLRELNLIGLLCPQLDSLEISESFLGEEGALMISQMLRNLQSIYLWDTRIGDYGLSRLVRNLPKLEHIILDGNNVTTKGALSICTFAKDLKELQLDHNLVDDLGALHLSQRFPTSRITTTSNLVSDTIVSQCTKASSKFRN